MLDIGTENSKSSSQSRREQIEKIIRKYSDLIFRTAYQNLKNYHDAQDITQEVCEGENIEKITYKIDNAVFCVKNGYKYVVDKDGQNDLFKLYGLTVGEKGEYNAYNSYTVNYDNQPDLSKYADEVTAPLQILGTFNEKNPNSGTRVNDKEVLSELYNSIFKDTVITVTATFKDGSTESQKLKLNCDSKGDEAFVEAKLIK